MESGEPWTLCACFGEKEMRWKHMIFGKLVQEEGLDVSEPAGPRNSSHRQLGPIERFRYMKRCARHGQPTAVLCVYIFFHENGVTRGGSISVQQARSFLAGGLRFFLAVVFLQNEEGACFVAFKERGFPLVWHL